MITSWPAAALRTASASVTSRSARPSEVTSRPARAARRSCPSIPVAPVIRYRVMRSLPLRGVPLFRAVLLAGPPCLVVAVPRDRLRESCLEVAEARSPTELLAELRGIDRVAQVVSGTVGDEVVGVGRLAELREDELDDLLVVLLAVGADQVRLADATLLEDGEHG